MVFARKTDVPARTGVRFVHVCTELYVSVNSVAWHVPILRRSSTTVGNGYHLCVWRGEETLVCLLYQRHPRFAYAENVSFPIL